MITETVKFDRPITNAWLVSDLSGTTTGSRPPAPERVPVPPSEISESADSSTSDHSQADHEQYEAKESNRLLEEISVGIQNLQLQSDPLVREFQMLAVRLATRIVKKVVGSSDGMKSERLMSLLDEAMRRPEPAVYAFVHPDFESKIRDWLQRESTPKPVLEIRIDDSLERGECRVGYATYELISNVESQLAQIEERLMEVVDNVID